MPNALSALSTPQVPEDTAANPANSRLAGGGIGGGGGGAATVGGGAPARTPAPTHEQTVATLRHMTAVAKELGRLLKSDKLGKSDVKSEIIDGAARLVAKRIISPSDAVQQLATFPDRPFDQKKWVEQNYVHSIDAMTAVLDHHSKSVVGTGNYDLDTAMSDASPERHMDTMRDMMSTHYA